MAITGHANGVLHFGAAADSYGDAVLLHKIVVQWDANGAAGNTIEFLDAAAGNAVATFKNTNGAWEVQEEDFGTDKPKWFRGLVLGTATNMDHNDVYLA